MTQADKVQKRESYQKFKRLYLFLKNKPDEFEIMREVHGMIDSYRGFGSHTNSSCAMESITQLEEDVEREKILSVPKNIPLYIDCKFPNNQNLVAKLLQGELK
jgi:hypothetical protein